MSAIEQKIKDFAKEQGVAIVGIAVFILVMLWRFVRAHESIAESMKIVAEAESTKVLADQMAKGPQT